MNSSQKLKSLINSGKTVFTAKDLPILWGENPLYAKINASRMTQRGLLIRLARGYYSINEQYSIYELANRIVSPSYISFQSALSFAGISFQERYEIDCAARFNYRKKIGAITFIYFKLKDDLLFNMQGIRMKEGLSVASPERATLDCLYLGFLPDIDHLEKLNQTVLKQLSVFYPQTIQKKVKDLL